MTTYRRVAQIRTANELRAYLQEIGVDLPFDDQMTAGANSPFTNPLTVQGLTIGNRFAVLPMEGWDGDNRRHPTDLVRRRWQHFGESGAKLIWGGEAVAVSPEARANPLQLMITDNTLSDLAALREHLVTAHRTRFGCTDDLVIGLQLTHSGRFARPYDKFRLELKILYHHPILDPEIRPSGRCAGSDGRPDRQDHRDDGLRGKIGLESRFPFRRPQTLSWLPGP